MNIFFLKTSRIQQQEKELREKVTQFLQTFEHTDRQGSIQPVVQILLAEESYRSHHLCNSKTSHRQTLHAETRLQNKRYRHLQGVQN